jgi:5,10-methylenetetrahydrofolate reductase
MEKKIEAGASFFQTQASYCVDDYLAFLEQAKKFNTKILIGILVLHSYEIAEYIHNEIPGISLPEEILSRFKNSTNQEETGIEIALEAMNKVDGLCSGFHLMTVRKEELIPTLLERFYETHPTA